MQENVILFLQNVHILGDFQANYRYLLLPWIPIIHFFGIFKYKYSYYV